MMVRVHAPAAQITGRVDGIVTPIDDHTCRLELASDSLDLAALVVGLLNVAFDVESPPELAEHLRALSSRFAAAAAHLRPPSASRRHGPEGPG
jgi:acyl carrier protein